MKILKHFLLSSLAGSLVFAGCASVEKTAAEPETDAGEDVENTPANLLSAATTDRDPYADLHVLAESMLLVREHYPDALAYSNIVTAAIDGMLRDLDPNSSFLSADQLSDLEEESEGSFIGIGVTVESVPEGAYVIAPIEDSPAFRAGIHAGDIIRVVDGQDLQGLTLDSIINLLKGEVGQPVTLIVMRANGQKDTLLLKRERVQLTSVKSVHAIGDIGYLRLTQFSETLPKDFAAGLAKLEALHVKGLVLDLRDNPGGVIDAAIAVAEQLLPEGDEIVTLRGRTARMRQSFKAGKVEHRNTQLPIACLVNSGSASASEILCGALQAHKRAVLVGQQTFGKASVQSIFNLQTKPDCALRLTTGFYYTPDGKMIHNVGLAPDLIEEMPDELWRLAQQQRMLEESNAKLPPAMKKKPVQDIQLDRAIEWLHGQGKPQAKETGKK